MDTVSAICFGLSRELDERSFKLFVQKFAAEDLLDVLAPRLTDEEIERLVATLTGVLRNHLSEVEYHRLFLNG